MEKLKIYDVGSVDIADAVNELIENHNKLSFRVNTLTGLVKTDLEHEKGYAKELTQDVIKLTKALRIAAQELYKEVEKNSSEMRDMEKYKVDWVKNIMEGWLKEADKIK